MADIIEFLEETGRKLENLHGHWFCPKTDSHDVADYSRPDVDDEVDEDGQYITAQTKRRRINDAKERHECAYDYSLVLGFTEEQMGDEQKKYTKQLYELLSDCDQCVRNYHMGRAPFLAGLPEKHSMDEDAAQTMGHRLSVVDFNRIDNGLRKAQEILLDLPDTARNKNALAPQPDALLALYEALCCEEYHKSNDNLETYFNSVFEMVQTKHTLKLGDIIPAMTHFLFDPDPRRLQFATTGWAKMPSELNKENFEWAVERPLRRAIIKYSQPGGAPMSDIRIFWEGAIVIANRLDQNLITHSLRAMEVQPDIYLLALHHLQYDSEEILKAIITLLIILMEKAPRDFWAAYNSLSPTTFSEQIFNSPAFRRSLAIPNNIESPGESSLPYVTSWIAPFLKSLPSTQQYDACNGLLHQLLEQLQKARLPEVSQMACCFAGLAALESTLQTFVDPKHQINAMTGRIVVNNMLGLVDRYKEIILKCADMTPANEDQAQLSMLGMQIIRLTLSLDCKALEAEYSALESDSKVQQGLNNHSEPIWQAVLDAFTLNSLDMAKSILVGITPLLGLEKFGQKDKKTPLPKDKLEFNRNFGQLSEIVSRVFERLSDFDQADLRQLFASEKTAKALVGGLTSAEQTTYEAAVEVIKSVTGTSGRKEAIRSLIAEAFRSSLSCFAWSSRQITTARTFASMPRLIKTSRDILDSLCDSQDGILRTKTLSAVEDRKVLMYWWEYQWRALGTSFEQMEFWSLQPQNSKDVMTDFARDAMEYAEALFDQYGVLASALDVQTREDEGDSSGALHEARKKLLDYPRKTMGYMVKWLRLRDPYLASTLVSLVSKILKRLGDFDMECDERALEYIGNVAIYNKVKTILTGQQKAELRKAVDEHHGIEEVQVAKAPIQTKQSKIDAWSRSAGGAMHEPSIIKTERSGVIDLEKWGQKAAQQDIKSLSSSIDRHKDTLSQMRARQQAIPSPMRARPNAGLDIKQSRAREKEEKAKRDAAQIAKAKSLRGETVVGEGSGLKGIGVQGKDHAPPRNEIMVNSDSDSDSDDGMDAAAAHAILAKGKMPSQSVMEYEESKRRALAQKAHQGPVKKIKAIRSKKDMRARIAPNMDNLHLTILGWDFFHDGDDPPSAEQCIQVSNTFETTEEYASTFHPLLISEAWRSFSSAKEESTFKPFDVKVVNRMTVDRYVEVSTTLPIAENRDLNIMETDIVLLSKGQNPMQDRHEPHCLARVFKTTRKKDVIDILYRISGRDPGGLMSTLSPNVKIRGIKITSMTTIEREYAALNSLDYYDLADEILTAKPSPILKYSDAGLQPLVRNYNVNMGQAKAIKSASDNDAFTLIQGPPGSGKTKTIVAMVGALLTESLIAGSTGVAINRPQIAGSAPPSAKPAMKKLLICAPSNAAVDELVMRLKQGVKTLRGDTQKINVVRLGRSEAVNLNVKDVTLDELVRIKLEGDKKDKPDVMSAIQKLHQDAGTLKEELNVIRPKLEAARKAGDKTQIDRLQGEFDRKKRLQAAIGGKIDENKDSGNTQQRANEINRRNAQEAIINGAHVLCSTLSGSGHDMFKNLQVEFETVIIDEAAQCIELSALIPLKYGCTKCILVGDPKQLPPTVLSTSAAEFGYQQSLFVRMQKNHPNDVHLLDTQYRMHPEISQFPSHQFYDGKLIDGPGMAALRKQPWHVSSLLGPYRFFDVKGVQASGHGHSFINNEEINVALQLYERLTTDFRSYNFKGKVGIITPYKAQLRELRERFQRRYGDEIFDDIDFNTTDAYQGRESEIIMFSCVRARASGGIGFLEDIRRMNVGLTRAKSSLWVLGNSQSLMQGKFWSRLVQNARERKRFTDGDVMALLRKPVARDAIPEAISTEVDMTDFTPSPAMSRQPSTGTDSIKSPDADVQPVPEAASSTYHSAPFSTGNLQHNLPMASVPRPRGGGNGLDETDCCSTCGSIYHSTYECDETEAKIAKGLQCGRCSELGHKKHECESPRCMNCGKVGHEQKICIDRAMSSGARQNVERIERDFKEWKANAPERRRQILEGGHNPKMPTVQVSAPPVPKQAGGLTQGIKRARQPSPTDHAGPSKRIPTGPRAMQTGTNQRSKGKNKDIEPQQPPSNLIDPRAAASTRTPTGAPTGVPSNIPPKTQQQQQPKPPMGFIPRKKPSTDPFIQKKKPQRRQ